MKLLKMTSGFLYFLLLLNPSAIAEDNQSPADQPPAVYSNPIYVNGYADGVAAGMNLCRRFPASCGIGTETSLTSSVEPIGGNYVINVIDGAKKCQENPESCGIQVNPNDDGSTQAGKAECQQDPESCGILVKGTKEEGIAQCRENPPSCDIEVDRDALIQEGIEMCKAHPSLYGIETSPPALESPLVASFSIRDGWLYLPMVEVLNPLDESVMTYEARLKLMTGMTPLSFSLIEAVPKISQ
jgi:hypothetical protein